MLRACLLFLIIWTLPLTSAQAPYTPLDGPRVVTEDFKMTGADADSIASVGWSVGAAGSGANAFIVAGAFRDNTAGPETGAAYVFRYDGSNWVEQQKLLASDAHSNDSFGQSASAYSGPGGEFVVVGAPKWPAFGMQGAAYVFRYNDVTKIWEEETRLVAADGEPEDKLGGSVVIMESLVIAAAPLDDDVGEDAGAVYAFRREPNGQGGFSWAEEFKMTASDGLPGDAFGRAVDITRTTGGDALCVVGPSSPDGYPAGALYIYLRESDGNEGFVWTEEDILTAANGEEFDHLGWAVATAETNSGTFVLGGAPGVNGIGINSGAAYIFRRESDGQGGFEWIEEATLTASDAAIADAFGWSVALEESPLGIVAIAGTRSDDNFRGAGYAYLRRSDGSWDEIAKLVASDGESGDFLGYSVGLSADWIAVGAPLDDPMGGPAGRGTVYAYNIQGVLVSTIGPDPVAHRQSMRVWPNPFYDHVFVSYSLDAYTPVELVVFDLLGRTVVRLDVVTRPSGEHTEMLDLADLPAGRYFLRLTTPDRIYTKISTKASVSL